MFTQTDRIYDYIFPLAFAKRTGETEYAYEKLVGTGFLIGNNGFALTAAHVIEQLQEGLKTAHHVMVALFRSESLWHPFAITDSEKHPTEDVAVFKISDEPWKSFFSITAQPDYSSGEFSCWGYPHAVAGEEKLLNEDGLDRPDLIYIQGYIRRRISRTLYPVSIYRGNQFYELSETIGGGMSGAPVIKRPVNPRQNWKIIGVYMGEKSEGAISHAVRAEAFAPDIFVINQI